MLALVIAFSQGFDYPYWTMMVVYILALDTTAAMRQKWVHMFLGTCTGAGIGILISAGFATSETAIIVAMMGVICISTFLACGERLPGFYGYMMVGTVCLLVAMPGITTPDRVWLRAIDRVQDIAVGAFVLFVVDTLFVRRNSHNLLLTVIDDWMGHLRTMSVGVLRGCFAEFSAANLDDEAETEQYGRAGQFSRDASVVLSTIGRIDVLSSHAPYDHVTSGKYRRRAAQAIRLRGLRLLPLLYLVNDIDTHRQAHDIPPPNVNVRLSLAGWIESGSPEGERAALRALLRDPIEAPPGWDGLLERIERRCLRGVYSLWRSIGSAQANLVAKRPARTTLPASQSSTPQALAHVDFGFRLRITLGALMNLVTFAMLWNLLKWVAADVAIGMLLSSSFYVIASRAPEPVVVLKKTSRILALAMAIVTLYVTVVFPYTSTMVTLALVLLPSLFVLGLIVADSGNVLFALLPMALLRLGNNGPGVDLPSLLNSVMSIAIGLCSALLWLVLLVRLPKDAELKRLRRVALGDLGDTACDRQACPQAFVQRALDRLILLSRLDSRDASRCEATRQMRVGINLFRIRWRLAPSSWIAAGVPRRLFGRRGDGTVREDAPLWSLVAIDTALREQPDAPLAVLCRIADTRLAMFPDAAPPAQWT
jgi:hypothetical protein